MTSTQQQSGLHLLDLCRAHPRHSCALQALAVLETYRARGAEARRQAEIKAAKAREREWAKMVSASSNDLCAIIEGAAQSTNESLTTGGGRA